MISGKYLRVNAVMRLVLHLLCLILTSPAAHTCACLCIPTALPSHLFAIKSDVQVP